MPRSRDLRIVFVAALLAMENSFSLRFAMRFSHDSCGIIVICRFYRIGQIFVSANGTGMKLSAVLRTGRLLCSFGIFMTERRPNVRFVSIAAIQTGMLDTTVSRTGCLYRFDVVVMSERKFYVPLVLIAATRTLKNRIALCRAGRLNDFRYDVIVRNRKRLCRGQSVFVRYRYGITAFRLDPSSFGIIISVQRCRVAVRPSDIDGIVRSRLFYRRIRIQDLKVNPIGLASVSQIVNGVEIILSVFAFKRRRIGRRSAST